MISAESFFENTSRFYEFLIRDYNYSLFRKLESQLSYSIIYKGNTRAVQIYFEPMENYSSVMIYRLSSNEEIPDWDDTLNSLPLHRAISKKNKNTFRPSKNDIILELEKNAILLKRFCNDILKGDTWIEYPEIKAPPIRVYDPESREWKIINNIDEI
jgi:hypothetical protein